MQRDKANFNILGRIHSERTRRNWTEYTLAKNAGLTQSTISTWYRKNLQPSVASLEKICDAFGISLSEFFMEATNTTVEDYEEEASSEKAQAGPSIPKDKRDLLYLWGCLNCSQRKAIITLLESIVDEQSM